MNFVFTAIVFIIVFSVIVLVHEFGHYWMAKRSGIKVEEFGLGLPPRIWGKRFKKNETIYSINWIPFGGFVRMLGEDATDPSMMRKKKSFVAQPMRNRVLVVIAGVVMNFLLAWFLLSVGFMFGMQPFLTPDDVLPAIDSGVIKLTQGAKVKDVALGSLADDMQIEAGDVLYSVDGKVVDEFVLMNLKKKFDGDYKFVRDGKLREVRVEESAVTELRELGLSFTNVATLPRVKIFSLDEEGVAYKAGLRSGDILISVNGRQVHYVDEYEKLVRGVPLLEYEIYRDGVKDKYIVEVDQSRRVIVSHVLPGTPAFFANLQERDVIVSVNGRLINDSLDLIEFVETHSDEKLAYLIERDGERILYDIQPKDGKIGVLLSELVGYYGEQAMSLYNSDLAESIDSIEDEQYTFFTAIYRGFGEMVRMSRLTAIMFVDVVRSVVSGGDVPDTVAGPVGIAQMTHMFVAEGFIPLLRFVAILSLSLGVINILPIPALDGGRLLFIIVEAIIGRRVSVKWESWIHAFGYVLILALLFFITYSDIMRLFQ